tara:strand:- start:1948 stop:2199 length:252 start_codon:yes stop_codon:yes gene_type:complete
MPIYVYACDDCEEEWKENHGMAETVEECKLCESQNVYRKPSMFSNLSKQTEVKREKVGSHVEEFIKNSKKELDRQKEDLNNKR